MPARVRRASGVTADEAEALQPGRSLPSSSAMPATICRTAIWDVAFRLVRGGAELLAMHRNPWWLTDEGETLDAGGFVAGLEFATGRQARAWASHRPRSSGRQSTGWRTDLDEHLPAFAFAMVGDDPLADIAATQRVGLRGVLVLSGKTRRSARDPAASRTRPRPARRPCRRHRRVSQTGPIAQPK